MAGKSPRVPIQCRSPGGLVVCCARPGTSPRDRRPEAQRDDQPTNLSRDFYREGLTRYSSLFLAIVSVAVLAISTAYAQVPDGCPEGFTGKDRSKEKNRPPASASSYTSLNAGNPITASAWFDQMCSWDTDFAAQRPWDKTKYQSKVIDGLETIKVKVRGWLVSVKKAPDDNDFHVEIGDAPKWESRHLIAEFPSIQFACAARATLADLIQKDIDKYHVKFTGNKHAFHKAVCVEVEGDIFLDMHHSRQNEADCETDGGRGLRVPTPGSKSHVVGIYEIHPAYSIEALDSSACSGP